MTTSRAERPHHAPGEHTPRERRRAVPVAVVVLLLGALLAAGAALPTHRVSAARLDESPSLIPAVDLTTPAATVWNCPGPLALNDGSTASVAITNVGSRPAKAVVQIAESVVTPASTTGHSLARHSVSVTVPPSSEADVALPASPVPKGVVPAPTRQSKKKGKRRKAAAPAVVDAAVSVTVNAPGVGVTETSLFPHGVLQSPCAPGSGSYGYAAAGLTSGSSDVHLSVFNPTATTGIVNLSIGTPGGYVVPAPLQGLTVAPNSLAVIDLGRYVPQRSHLAVQAKALVGRIVVGCLTTTSTRIYTSLLGPGHSYEESGNALVVGVGRAATRWISPLSGARGPVTDGVQIFNPGSRAAALVVATDTGPGHVAKLKLTVGPGKTVVALAPVAGKPGDGGSKAPPAEGTVAVSSTNAVGVVVERDIYRTLSRGHVLVVSSAPYTLSPSTWLLGGVVEAPHLGEVLYLTNPGARPLDVLAEAVPVRSEGIQSEPSSVSQLGAFKVAAFSAVVVNLRSLVAVSPATRFGLELRSSGAVLASGGLIPTRGTPTVAPAIPVG